MDQSMSGRVAVVTGGASGIGAATCRRLAVRGAHVVVADLNLEGARELAEEIGGSHVRVDVTDPTSTVDMVRRALAVTGRVDIAVNNAGIGLPIKNPVGELAVEDWKRVMTVNADGVFYCLRAQLAVMGPAGSGSIVNVASVLGAVGTSGGAAYVASKHAVVGLTKAAAVDYAAKGVRINAVGPGFVDTPLLSHHDADVRARTEQRTLSAGSPAQTRSPRSSNSSPRTTRHS